jgi:hypothetical protein
MVSLAKRMHKWTPPLLLAFFSLVITPRLRLSQKKVTKGANVAFWEGLTLPNKMNVPNAFCCSEIGETLDLIWKPQSHYREKSHIGLRLAIGAFSLFLLVLASVTKNYSGRPSAEVCRCDPS